MTFLAAEMNNTMVTKLKKTLLYKKMSDQQYTFLIKSVKSIHGRHIQRYCKQTCNTNHWWDLLHTIRM